MPIQMTTPKESMSRDEVKAFLNAEHNSRIVTPEQARAILTYTVEDAERDRIKQQADEMFNEALLHMSSIVTVYEQMAERQKRNSIISIDTKKTALCKDIITFLRNSGGKVDCTTESNFEGLRVNVSAEFAGRISFGKDTAKLAELSECCEIMIHKPYEGDICIEFSVPVGRYINNR